MYMKGKSSSKLSHARETSLTEFYKMKSVN
jgi:hypothetical protein